MVKQQVERVADQFAFLLAHAEVICYHRGMRLSFGPAAAGGVSEWHGCRAAVSDPTAEDIVARLAKKRAELTSFTADSTMDYWLGSQRVKGEVLVMGTPGAKVRFAALSPAGGAHARRDGVRRLGLRATSTTRTTARSPGRATRRRSRSSSTSSSRPTTSSTSRSARRRCSSSATGTLSWDASTATRSWSLEERGRRRRS